MESLELLERISKGEDSFTQFKREINDSNKLSEEMVAFSNAEGGVIIVGVDDDDGTIVGVENEAIPRLNQLISNVANENIRPPIYPLTEIVEIGDKKVVVIHIKKGDNKPYQTSKGIYLTKSGSDKCKMSPEKLRRLFAESRRIFADEEIIEGSSIGKVILPYSGYGSGIKRALSIDPSIEFINDVDKEEFKCVIKRY